MPDASPVIARIRPTDRTSRMPRRSPLPRIGLLVAAVAMVAAACSPTTSTSLQATGLSPQPDGWRGIPIELDRTLPDVTLQDTDGASVELADAFLGTPTLLFFGYTSCPDICPIHLAAIASAMREANVTFDELDVVFVSVDPERDTPERIDDYIDNFSPRIAGLHADLDVIEDALGQLDLPGPIVEGADPRGEGDLIGHPAQVIGFDADGEAHRVWPFGTRRSDWIVDLPRIVDEW
jgi:protein SCO1